MDNGWMEREREGEREREVRFEHSLNGCFRENINKEGVAWDVNY
jgi:hypothetical protein